MRFIAEPFSIRYHESSAFTNLSPRLEALFVCPGNGGTASGLPRVQNVVHIRPDDLGKLVTFARAKRINFVVIGPEAPLIAGVADHFRSAGLTCFGPSLRASRMEGSKTFAKDFMARHNIPTAKYLTGESAPYSYLTIN